MMKRVLLPLFALMMFGCNPEFEVYAPERPTFIVYGVLDATKDVQFVKLTETFQSQGDALAYAETADLALKDMQVTIKGNGKLYEGELEEIQREEGLFPAVHTVYKFNTSGADKIVGEETYTLTIKDLEDSNLLITANTVVPGDVNMVEPAAPRYNSSLGVYFLPIIDLHDDYFARARSQKAYGFEVRFYVEVEQEGSKRTIQYGPLPIQNEPRGCSATVGRGEMCLKVPGGSVGNYLLGDISKIEGQAFHYDSVRTAMSLAELSKTTWVEITAVDSFLTRYLQVNNPFGFGLNLLIDKPELSNVFGADAGLFGSINHSFEYVKLDDCTKYKAGFLTTQPSHCE